MPLDAETASSLRTASRAWFSAPIAEFLGTSRDEVLGRLTHNAEFAVEPDQRDAWLDEIDALRTALAGMPGSISLEFNIPRMGKRIDAVVLTRAVIFVIEFKQTRFDHSALEQAWDYALDLKNFHEGSHHAPIVPIVVAEDAPTSATPAPAHSDGVFEPFGVQPGGLRAALDEIVQRMHGGELDAAAWHASPYRPTPTIIEAARALYAQHGVQAIRCFDAGKHNLAVTSGRVEEIVRNARKQRRKAICFVTGVPGAGKTLVGLNLATQHQKGRATDPAVFLSGNGPLVAVLREALTRDEFQRRKLAGESVRKGKVGESVKQFIQNVHHFRDDNLQHPGAPPEHVAIFDEAQRAWNLAMTTNFMQRKKHVAGFNQSEPEYLISCMDRHRDWAVIVCLVGGGQEINTGEAGIQAWLEAAMNHFSNWDLHISSNLHDSEYAADDALMRALKSPQTTLEESLHLAVSMRSFRAERLSHFVKALLDRDTDAAREACGSMRERYPIRITRDLTAAKQWVREMARGSERFGLVCSSKAMRLKPHAIDVRHNVNPVHWFLNGQDDTRSSQYLEDAATEFQVQGLELDWACVNWDADLRSTETGWSHHDFRGKRWVNIHNKANRKYLLNAYRVLLTRARQGMVLFVPPGDAADPTRLPEMYDGTFNYLKSAGLAEL
ncbi:MAG: DUF2075 domain-containing protein [Planctomycetes bacterium]|nr:DUF2075 domain-containing protein [Planctomycetota bacterium]